MASMSQSLRRPAVAPLLALPWVLLVPYGYTATIGLGGSNHIVVAIFWEFVSSFHFTGMRLVLPAVTVAGFAYTLLRFAVVYQVYRFYQGSATKGQMFLLALVSELPPLILSIPAVMGFPIMPAPFFEYVIPIPTMFVLVAILVFAFPPKLAKSPW